ncbi:MAG: Hsp33 family molecular chaperone HslO [Balneola sp.]|nr:Hsp33 family molecular chaperone HslO [Balneola sp.]|tara:strand:- start:5543 stop:6451 length:909 start_codon:yes stop_codon:yes gene_type:complete
MSIAKEKFLFKDRLVKGVTKDGHFKLSVVKTTALVNEAKDRHGLSLLATVILGKTLTAAALLASELKKEERIQIRLDGNGPLQYVIAEANSLGEVRGYVGNPRAELAYNKPDVLLSDGIGLGVLSLTKVLYNEAEPRTSSIELIAGDVTRDIAHYLAKSEQVPSAVILDIGITKNGAISEAGGLLLQRLPDAPDGQIDMLHERLASFQPIDQLFSEKIYVDEIMHRSVSPIQVKELSRNPVDFFCRCSRKRFLSALTMLSLEDLEDIKYNDQEIVCHFCNNKQYITAQEIRELITKAKANRN